MNEEVQIPCHHCGEPLWPMTMHTCPSDGVIIGRKLDPKLDRIIELLEQQINQLSILVNTARPYNPADLMMVNPIHYPLPGDPEPTTQPSFQPMTPDDQAAVERWSQESHEPLIDLYLQDPPSVITSSPLQIIERLCEQYRELEKVLVDPSYAKLDTIYMHHPSLTDEENKNA